jgi:hypothetical protein
VEIITLRTIFQTGCANPMRRIAALVKGLACLGMMGLALAAPARAAVTLSVNDGVDNPPAPLASTGLTPPQVCYAYTAAVVPVDASATGVLQATLTAQKYSNANNWTLSGGVVSLDPNATFGLSQYELILNPAGTAFGENVDFTLSPNLAKPAGTPANAVVTEHWLQLLNEDQRYNDFGYTINGYPPGIWKLDNGSVEGTTPSGAASGPYYDSNGDPGFSVPPSFFDGPQFYSGVGTFFRATAIPTWDVYVPATMTSPATETIDVGDYGVSWGFYIVPEPATGALIVIGFALIRGTGRVRRERSC